MPYISKKNFEKYVETSKNFIKFIQETECPTKEPYPKDMDLGELEGEKIKLIIDRKNKSINNGYESIKKEAESCKKNLETMLNSKKEGVFGLIHYNKIKTNHRGKVDLIEFVQYVKIGMDIYMNLLNDQFE